MVLRFLGWDFFTLPTFLQFESMQGVQFVCLLLYVLF